MSEARKIYYKSQCIDVERGVCDAHKYVTELEQQKAELIEFIKNIEDTNLDELLDVKIPEILEKYTGGE